MKGVIPLTEPSTAQSPRYIDIFNRIKADIERGELAAQSKLPSYNELIERYGSSLTTIVRVIGELRARGYVSVISNRNYVQYPPSNEGRVEQLICVVIPETLLDQYWAGILEGILSKISEINRENELNQNPMRFSAVVYYVDELQPSNVRTILADIAKKFENIGGFLCMPPYGTEADAYEPILVYPTVFIDRWPVVLKDYLDTNFQESSPEWTWIKAENTKGAEKAMRHLYRIGCRTFHVVPEAVSSDGSREFDVMEERIQGCRTAFNSFQKAHDPIGSGDDLRMYVYIHSAEDYQNSYRGAVSVPVRFPEDNPAFLIGQQLFLNDGPTKTHVLNPDLPPVAVFCLQDVLASGMWRAIQEAEKATRQRLLGRRIALMSFDDTPIMKILNISSMQNPGEMGEEAVKKLNDRLSNPSQPLFPLRCEVKMQIRDSTKYLALRPESYANGTALDSPYAPDKSTLRRHGIFKRGRK